VFSSTLLSALLFGAFYSLTAVVNESQYCNTQKKVKNEICLDETRLGIVQSEKAEAVKAIPMDRHPSRHQLMKVLRIQLPGLLLQSLRLRALRICG
jgi:hypothetical protein